MAGSGMAFGPVGLLVETTPSARTNNTLDMMSGDTSGNLRVASAPGAGVNNLVTTQVSVISSTSTMVVAARTGGSGTGRAL
jgi:hypothetical protein